MTVEVAVVTGAAGALGCAVVSGLCTAGWSVIAVDIKPFTREREETFRALSRVRGVIADVSDPRQVSGLARQVGETGPIRGLVNCAGVLGPVGPAQELRVEEWDQVQSMNVRSAWLTCCAFYPQLQQTCGRVVNVSSTAGCEGSPGLAAYSASKAALLGLTRTLALEWASAGVLVNSVVPGLIDSGVSDSLPTATKASIQGKIPLGRAASCDEVAAVIEFLLSPRASYITGEYWRVDGGR